MDNRNLEWEERLSAYLHSDRAAVDLGMMCLKTALVVNSGALVALLAFLGGATNLSCAALTPFIKDLVFSAYFFGAGVSAAAIDTAIAYFYQSGIAGATWIPYKRRHGIKIEAHEQVSARISRIAVYPMVILAVASVVLFIVGTYSVLCAYSEVDFTSCASSIQP